MPAPEKSDFVKLITARINERIDILGEWVSEETEAYYISKIAEYFERVSSKAVQSLLIDASDGLNDEELEEHTKVISTEITNFIVQPVPEPILPLVSISVFRLVEPIVSHVLGYAREGLSL